MDTLSSSRLAEIVRDLSAHSDLRDVAGHIVDAAMELTSAEYGSVQLIMRGTWSVAAASGDLAAQADHWQHTLGEGPALTAATGDVTVDATVPSGPDKPIVDVAPTVVSAADLLHERRWAEWVPRATALGLRSAVSATLRTPFRTVGVLTLYSSAPLRSDTADLATIEILATHAAVVVTRRLRESFLREAADFRNLLGQAQGIIMERHDLDAKGALDLIRRRARETDLPIRQAAEAIITEHDVERPHSV